MRASNVVRRQGKNIGARGSAGAWRTERHRTTPVAALALVIALAPAVAIFLGTNTTRAAGADVSFLRRDYDLSIQRNGDVAVAERWQLRFSGGPYTSATLGVFLTHTQLVDFQSIQGADPNSEHVARVADSQGHAIEQISWTFPATQDTTRAFTIPYTLHAAIAQNQTQAWLDHHFFDGPGRGTYQVAATQVTVTLPVTAGAGDVQAKTAYPGAQLQTSRPSDTTVVVQGQNLNSEQLLEVAVIFPRDLLDASAAKPAWQRSDTPPNPPTPLDADISLGSSPAISGSGPASFLSNVGLVLAVGLVILAILGFLAWRLSKRLAADIRELAAIKAGSPMDEAEDDSPGPAITKQLPAIDLNFGEVEWPTRDEELDLSALGLHPLDMEAAANEANDAAAGDGGDNGSPSGAHGAGENDDSRRGAGATSGVGSGDEGD